ncbi:MAG: D-amino acid dehydrogenase [Betaproteobacteria bacterium]|nr:MAG: D-amino acid dehydrogenase [Betaproteobacteria bacterium]
MKIAVLGAGVVGVSSAWYLSRAGHEVTLIDRQDSAAAETSFANGGQISTSHAEPWANPSTPRQILKWLGREDAPMLFRLRADPRQWIWGLSFLRECLPARSRANAAQIAAINRYSRAQLQALRDETGIEYERQARGILRLFQDRRALDEAIAAARVEQAHGIDLRVLSAADCIELEPALSERAATIAGGVWAPADESGDAHKFTQELARMCARRGVEFRCGSHIAGIESSGGRVLGVRLGTGDSITADAYVVALGSYSPLLLRPMGISIPVYPLKGYSITLPLAPGDVAPQMSISDGANKLVMSRLGNCLRVAGTAELAGYDTAINEVRCKAIVARTFELFPRAGRPHEAQFWAGLRPATPGGVPCIGRTSYPNLYLNTGHGTLGWTMACGAGAAIADIVSGRKPELEFNFLRT